MTGIQTDHTNQTPAESERMTLRDLLVWAGIPLVIVLFLRLFIIGVYEIPSASMDTTLQVGDRVVASKLTPKFFSIKRGDIVIFKDPNNWLGETTSSDLLIKRVIGLPGDTVACAGAGQPVTVNGHAIDDSEFIRAGVNPSDYEFNVTVTENHLFVMGDNRSNSADSRVHQGDGDHGLVPINDVQSVAFAVYWPISHWNVLNRPDDAFANVGGVEGAK
ncbi:signal peptidase I [Bifidobacterium vansinderenii]|uniref:Signal peptidase I n=1 Tax=Bifidobacterium vansinderenii TaxID=1984871 RepID=A0A229VXH8_9BIFI|nr:signal peptidase I [Bifidobacterium vansinderenii]OXN00323.1 signal peptidase [Bifidobacterium vansinderenii]